MQDFLFRVIPEYFESILTSFVSFIQRIESLDRTVSAKLEESLIPYWNEYNFNVYFSWILNHIIITILGLTFLVFLWDLFKPTQKDKVLVFLNNLESDITNLSLQSDNFKNLSEEQLKSKAGILEEIVIDISFIKNYLYFTNTSPKKYKKYLKKIEVVVADMLNRLDKKSASTLLPKLNQLNSLLKTV
ncbi:MAG: hypothetical protein QNJ54_19600 [Prochloraceae cyanobacterium]|nr:hypothetical protein [Prochloraceae cyanobacterium]